MTPNVQEKLEEILKGNITFISSNLALNMLISILRRKAESHPEDMPAYIGELDEFMTRYAAVMGDEFEKIEKL